MSLTLIFEFWDEKVLFTCPNVEIFLESDGGKQREESFLLRTGRGSVSQWQKRTKKAGAY